MGFADEEKDAGGVETCETNGFVVVGVGGTKEVGGGGENIVHVGVVGDDWFS